MINLLPPLAKKKYQLELLRRLFILYSIGLFIIIAIFSGLIYSVKIYLDINRGSVVDSIKIFENTSQYQSLQKMQAEAQLLNNEIKKINASSAVIIKTSPIFRDIFIQMPAGIYINSLVFDVAGQKLVINGFSARRNDILGFKKNLESVKWIKKVNSPTTNILKETNSAFVFEILTDLKPQHD